MEQSLKSIFYKKDESVFMLSHTDQQGLFKSVYAFIRSKHKLTVYALLLCLARVFEKLAISSKHNFWQHNKVAMSTFRFGPFWESYNFGKFYNFSHFSSEEDNEIPQI